MVQQETETHLYPHTRPTCQWPALVLVLISASLFTAPAAAATLASTSIAINQSLTGGNSTITRSIALPDILGLDSIDLELAHTFRGDLQITLFAPTGEDFRLVNSGFSGGSLGLVTGSSALANVAPYRFQQVADGPAWGGPGPYRAAQWPTGPFAAGDWILRIADTFPPEDNGAVGLVTLNYQVVPLPPAALLLLSGLAVLGGLRRRPGGRTA